MKTVCYYLPYSARAVAMLKWIQRKFGATYSVNEKEEVTITAKEKYIAKIEKILAPLV